MPPAPRKRPVQASIPVSKDAHKTPCKTPTKGTDEAEPPQKRQKRSVLGEKASPNIPEGNEGAGSKARKPVVKVPKRINLRVATKDKENIDDQEPAEPAEPAEPSAPTVIVLEPAALRNQVIVALTFANANRLPITCLPSTSTPDEIAGALTAHSLWSPILLAMFQYEPLTTLKITIAQSNPTGLPTDPSPVLKRLFVQGAFTSLTSLNLTGLPMSVDNLSYLRLLPNLSCLDLTNTGIDTRALSNLVCFRVTLHTLNLTGNPLIRDDAKVPLFTLSGLRRLYLKGTGFTVPGMRRLVDDLKNRPPLQPSALPTKQLQIHLVTVPNCCLLYFRGAPQWAANIPEEEGYVKEARLVPGLGTPALEQNLRVHKKVNRFIALRGTRVEMVGRLMEVLEKRRLDPMVRQAMVGPGEKVGVGEVFSDKLVQE